MGVPRTEINLLVLLAVNVILLCMHVAENCHDVYYFFQLTIIGQVLVILNFFLSIVLHEKKSGAPVRLFLSRLHLVGISLEAVVVAGFWILRIFFRKGIIKEGEEMSLYVEMLSVWVHGGSFLTLLYFVKTDQIVMERKKRIKYFIHLLWGIPFVCLQYLRWSLTGEHVYGFLEYLSWVQIIAFYSLLYCIAVGIDYVFTIRHGLKLTIKHMSSQHQGLEDLQKEKQKEEQRQYEKQRRETSRGKKQ